MASEMEKTREEEGNICLDNDSMVEIDQRKKELRKIIIGYLLATLMSVMGCFFALSLYRSHISVLEHIFVQSILGLVVSTVFMTCTDQFQKITMTKREWMLMLIKCEVTVIGWGMGYSAVTLIEPGDASALMNSAFVISVPIACLYLRETCGFLDILSIFMSFAGILLVSRPSLNFLPIPGVAVRPPTKIGIVCALVGAVCQALHIVLLRRLKHVHILSHLFFDFALCTLQLPMVSLFVTGWTAPSRSREIIYFLVITTAFQSFQFLMNKVSQMIGVAPLSFILTLQPLLIYLIGVIIFKVPLVPLAIGGACLILMSIMVVVIRQTILFSYPRTNESRWINFLSNECFGSVCDRAAESSPQSSYDQTD